MAYHYHYHIEDCQVADKACLDKYRGRRSEWLHLLRDDDQSVMRQITAMLWSDAVFRAINETRRLSQVGGYKSAALNGAIAQFIDQGFVATQTLSIRKLMEKASKDRNKQIVSLRRVFDDIRAHRHLLTREHYVAYDGLPYDPEPGERAYVEKLIKKGDVHSEWLASTGPEAWSTSQRVHERFDKLSGVSREHRSRGDLIREEVFEKTEALLAGSGWSDIVAFGNKFVAHAADQHSRGTLLDGQHGFSLDKLAQCHEGICRAAAAICGPILYEGSSGLFPSPQFDQFENLDAQWLSPSDVNALSVFWDAHVHKVDTWTEGDPLG
ncbi:hypothetical protein [Rhizobium sp. RAF56]|uniref:hypothetical protein n=1 Tax=Rhizobium sp. RAF56 TaxID=3233062 RepID=UPI003F957EC2